MGDALAQAQLWLDEELERHGFGTCTFVTCGDWDLKTMMSKQCNISKCHVPERFRQWLNIKDLFGSVLEKKGGGMAEMLRALKLELVGHHHSGIDDCRNIARILQVLIQKGGLSHVETLVKSGHVSGPSSFSKGKGRGPSGKYR